MTTKDKLSETMKAVSQADQVLERFHQNVADLFRLICHKMEESEPAYAPTLEQGAVWTSSISPLLRKSSHWRLKHFALPLQPLEDEAAPLVLLNISIDTNFNKSPELWLGLIHRLESFQGDSFPFREATQYIFQDYFGPEEGWSQPRTWYVEEFEDEEVRGEISFCRIPLHELNDVAAVQQEVCERIQQQIETLLSSDASDETEDDEG